MAVYAHQVAGFDDAMIRNLLIVSTVFAAMGSLIFGWITDRWGAKRTLTAVLYLWIVTLVAAIASFSPWTFWLVGFLVGCALGGTWVSARALVLDLSPLKKLVRSMASITWGGSLVLSWDHWCGDW